MSEDGDSKTTIIIPEHDRVFIQEAPDSGKSCYGAFIASIKDKKRSEHKVKPPRSHVPIRK